MTKLVVIIIIIIIIITNGYVSCSCNIYMEREREREESVMQFIYKTMLQYLRANLKLREVLSLSLYIYIKKQFLFK